MGASSVVSSTMTMRSVGETRPSNVASTVVLPVPVPPLIKNARRECTRARNTSAISGVERAVRL